MISRSCVSMLRTALNLPEYVILNNVGRSSRVLGIGSRFTSAATESNSSSNEKTDSTTAKTIERVDGVDVEAKLAEKDKLLVEKDKLLKEIQVSLCHYCLLFNVAQPSLVRIHVYCP